MGFQLAAHFGHSVIFILFLMPYIIFNCTFGPAMPNHPWEGKILKRKVIESIKIGHADAVPPCIGMGAVVQGNSGVKQGRHGGW